MMSLPFVFVSCDRRGCKAEIELELAQFGQSFHDVTKTLRAKKWKVEDRGRGFIDDVNARCYCPKHSGGRR